MTDDRIALRELLEKGSDATFLRELIGFAVLRLMELDMEARCGAAHGERSAERLCRKRAEREGWSIVATYADAAISGVTTQRPGYKALLGRLTQGSLDIVLAESLDRFSRDQEHIAAFFKAVTFAGVRIVTLAEGDICELHIGLMGTMNALYLKDLADKARRGEARRILKGRSIGGAAYGYRIVRRLGSDWEPERGLREIDQAEAMTVQRIFRDYAAGANPLAIARALIAEGIPGPIGRP